MAARSIAGRRTLVGLGITLGVVIALLRVASTGHAAELQSLQTGALSVGGGSQPQVVIASIATVGRVFVRTGAEPCTVTVSFRSASGSLLSQQMLAPATGNTDTTSVSGGPFSAAFTSVRVRFDLTAGSFDWCLPTVAIGRLGSGAESNGETQVVISQTDLVPAIG